MSEQQILLNISERIVAKAIREAQIAARKLFRTAAKEQRDKLQILNDQLTDELAAAIDASDEGLLSSSKTNVRLELMLACSHWQLLSTTRTE